MDANEKSPGWKHHRWQDLALDVTVPLVFAVMTAGFFALVAQ